MSQLMKEFKLTFPLPLFAWMKTNKSVNVGESGLCNLGCVCITWLSVWEKSEFTINNMHTAKWERQNKENTEQQCRRNKDKEHLYIEQWAPLRVRSISESEGEMRKRLEFFSESGLTWICRRPELFRRKLQFGEHEWLTKFATPASFVLGKRKSLN